MGMYSAASTTLGGLALSAVRVCASLVLLNSASLAVLRAQNGNTWLVG